MGSGPGKNRFWIHNTEMPWDALDHALDSFAHAIYCSVTNKDSDSIFILAHWWQGYPGWLTWCNVCIGGQSL